MFVLGQLTAFSKVCKPGDKRKLHTKYTFHGKVICRDAFCFINSIGETRLKNLKSKVPDSNVSTREHGNKGHSPANTTPLVVTQHVKNFIKNFAILHGYDLPGRVPEYKDDKITLLQANQNRKYVFREYEKACAFAEPKNNSCQV